MDRRTVRGLPIPEAFSYLALFLFLLAAFPLRGVLPGNHDTLVRIDLARTYLNEVAGFFAGRPPGTAYYPAGHLARYGDPTWGAAALFLAFKLAARSDLWAYYLYLSVLFALNALGACLLAGRYTPSRAAAWYGGLAFSTCAFLWANIDDALYHCYFFPCLSAVLLLRAADRRSVRTLLLAAVAAGLQAYFSLYVLFYGFLLLAAAAVSEAGRLRAAFRPRDFAWAAAAGLLTASPVLAFGLATVASEPLVDVWRRPELFRLRVEDFLTALPGRPLSLSQAFVSVRSSAVGLDWVAARRNAYLGLTLPVMALGGALTSRRDKGLMLALGVLGAALALGCPGPLGPGLWGGLAPACLLERAVPLMRFIRIPLRAFTLSCLGLALLGALGMESLLLDMRRRGWRPGWAAAAFAAVVLTGAGEAVPWPVRSPVEMAYPRIPPAYAAFFEGARGSVILDLPSLSLVNGGYLNQLVYGLWQTEHRQDILGGFNAYYPSSRIEIERQVSLLPSSGAFEYLIKLGVTHVVVHRLAVVGAVAGRAGSLGWAESSCHLAKVGGDAEASIYELRPCGPGPGIRAKRRPAKARRTRSGSAGETPPASRR